jgi:hypothetical protein
VAAIETLAGAGSKRIQTGGEATDEDGNGAIRRRSATAVDLPIIVWGVSGERLGQAIGRRRFLPMPGYKKSAEFILRLREALGL